MEDPTVIAVANHAWFGIHREVMVIIVLVALVLTTLMAAVTTDSYTIPSV